ncbi:MAG: protein-disulfide reductase DsbD family protein [Dehalococcoidia bacterium]
MDLSAHPGATGEAGVSAVLASPRLTFQQKTAVLVRLDLDAGMHVYGQPIPDRYVATTVTVSAPESVVVGEPIYPATKPFAVEGLNEAFHVFEGKVEIEVPLLSSEIEAETVSLDIQVHYQACDERACYMPQTVRLAVEAPVGKLNRPPRRG